MDKTTIFLIITVIVLLGVILYLVRRYNYNRMMAYVQSIPTRAETFDVPMWTEIRRYQASWGDWYVQVSYDEQIRELRFAAEPSDVELFEAVKAVLEAEAVPVSVTL